MTATALVRYFSLPLTAAGNHSQSLPHVLLHCSSVVSKVDDEDGSHWEMSGCAPAVQSALMTGGPLPTDTVAALVAFCKELQGAVTA
jgi:hypothetical protein